MHTNGSEYARIYASVQASLSTAPAAPRHVFAPCPTCRIHVCLTHHDSTHPRR